MNSNQIVGAVMLPTGAIISGAGLIAHAIGMAGKVSVSAGEAGLFLGGFIGLFGLVCLLGGSMFRKRS